VFRIVQVTFLFDHAFFLCSCFSTFHTYAFFADFRTGDAKCYVSHMKSYVDRFTPVVLVEASYGNVDMFTFEPSQSEKRRADLADSSNAFKKPRAFIITLKKDHLFLEKITSPHAFPTKLFKRIAPKLRLVIFEKTKLWQSSLKSKPWSPLSEVIYVINQKNLCIFYTTILRILQFPVKMQQIQEYYILCNYSTYIYVISMLQIVKY